MKKLSIFVLLLTGLCAIYAQDLIVLKNGDMIMGKIVGTSFSEINYKNFYNLNGPITSILSKDVHSILYEDNVHNNIVRYEMYKNGSLKIDNIENPYKPKYIPETPPQTAVPSQVETAPQIKNDDKLVVGINANAGGLIPLGDSIKAGGPALNIEFIKNNFYSIINLSLPIQDNVGFGFSGLFSYYWKSKIGGFYLGGGLGYTYHTDHFFTFGANVGYRFVTSFGMYFGVGAYVGGKVNENIMLDLKPVLGVGYDFK